MVLHCNTISHWLGAYIERSLACHSSWCGCSDISTHEALNKSSTRNYDSPYSPLPRSNKWFNSLTPGKFEWNFKYVIFKRILVIDGWDISHCPYMNVTGLHWWSVNIGSGNGLVPSGSKPLPEPMLTQICRHMASLGHNELILSGIFRACRFSKFLLAQLPKFCLFQYRLYMIWAKTLPKLKCACPTDSFTCPGLLGNGICQALLSLCSMTRRYS